MEEVCPVNVDSDAGFQQLLIIGFLGQRHHRMVPLLGHDQVNLDPAEHGRLHGLEQRLIRDEVRRREDHLLAGPVDQGDEEPLVVLGGVVSLLGERGRLAPG
jgi:hypothetical protein